MGSSYSTEDIESKWKVGISLKKGDTTIDYTLTSNSNVMGKKVTGSSVNGISFNVDAKTSQMKHEDIICGTDGDLGDLKIAVKLLIEKLGELLIEEEKVEEVMELGSLELEDVTEDVTED